MDLCFSSVCESVCVYLQEFSFGMPSSSASAVAAVSNLAIVEPEAPNQTQHPMDTSGEETREETQVIHIDISNPQRVSGNAASDAMQ